jgi:hemolysin activation/secretion protein
MKYGETRELLWMKNSQNKRICKVMAFAALGVAQAVCISAAETEQLPTDAQRTTLQEMTQRKPDAGMLQNEWRDRQRLAASQITNGSGSVQIPEGQKSALNMDTTTKVRVNEFKITGQDVVEDKKLQELLADKKRKDLTFADLQQGTDTLTQYFRSMRRSATTDS